MLWCGVACAVLCELLELLGFTDQTSLPFLTSYSYWPEFVHSTYPVPSLITAMRQTRMPILHRNAHDIMAMIQ